MAGRFLIPIQARAPGMQRFRSREDLGAPAPVVPEERELFGLGTAPAHTLASGHKPSVPDPGLTGYGHPAYASAFHEFGEPLRLSQCGASLLKRRLPGGGYDAMGCYPVFSCRHWDRLGEELDQWSGCLVSVALVPDPFGAYDLPLLRSAFPLVRKFKEHFVVPLQADWEAQVCPHHRRNIRLSSKQVTIEKAVPDAGGLNEWLCLYAHLIERKGIRGLRAFSRCSFERQFSIPGLTVFRAIAGKRTVGMTLWYRQGNAVYYHLGACSEPGYACKAFYSLFAAALSWFSSLGLAGADLGGGEGLAPNDDGLTRFKRGWSSVTQPVYFCGRILDHAAFARLSPGTDASESAYFPPYRAGEFL